MKAAPQTLNPTDRAALARKRLSGVRKLMESCRLCPRRCRSRRFEGETGDCGLGPAPLVSSVMLHHGEEPLLSGRGGSGTIFFAGCNLNCLFCQNYDISQLRIGQPMPPGELAQAMLRQQRRGAENINFVTPTPNLPAIVEALAIAWEQGLTLPIVYNCGGYESEPAIRLLDGLIDVYLADFKYGSDEAGAASAVEDYFTRVTHALPIMWEQVGRVVVDGHGVVQRGLIIRHLVLPGHTEDSLRVVRWIADNLGTDAFLSLMSQYRPSWKAREHEPFDRRVRRDEYDRVLAEVRRLGFGDGYHQPGPFF